MSISKQQWSFLQFLQGCQTPSEASAHWKKVIIPIIQRDYAQGRQEQGHVRGTFLKALLEAMTGEKGTLVLDFVYGCIEKDCRFYPLDGQQRLTTLWLLHWYLAFLNKDAEMVKILENFSYETRYSSREFCLRLCALVGGEPEDAGNDIREYIRERKWFSALYGQDPTICGMLCTLAELQERMRTLAAQQQALAREWLKKLHDGAAAPIVFYVMPLGADSATDAGSKLPLTDDLYIKMNARGKRLTDVENFKADLLDYRVQHSVDEEGKTQLVRLVSLIEDAEGRPVEGTNCFSHLLDTRWTNLFWEFKSDAGSHIDESMMVFFQRFFRCWYLAHGGPSQRWDEQTGKNVPDEVYAILHNEHRDYGSFDAYEKVLVAHEGRKCVQRLYDCLNNLCCLYQQKDSAGRPYSREEVSSWFVAPWNETAEKPFSCIPAYEKGQEEAKKLRIEPLTEKQYAVFYGACMYLAHCGMVCVESFRDWMRFVWNMAENCATSHWKNPENAPVTIENSRRLIHALHTMAERGAVVNVTEYLKAQSVGPRLSSCREEVWKLLGNDGDEAAASATRQLHEECMKAKRKSESAADADIISQAEKHPFFKGSVACLFMTEDGALEDWANLGTKWATAQQLFKENGLVPEAAHEEDRLDKQVRALKIFFSKCPDDWALAYPRRIYNTNATTWRNAVLRAAVNGGDCVYAKPLHHMLMHGADAGVDVPSEADSHLGRCLLQGELIRKLLSVNPGQKHWIINWLEPRWFIHYKGTYGVGLFLDDDVRDKALDLLKDAITLWPGNERIPGSKLVMGLDVYFSFEGAHFCWYRDHRIFLVDEHGVQKERLLGKEKQTYCFACPPNDAADDAGFKASLVAELRKLKAADSDGGGWRRYGR